MVNRRGRNIFNGLERVPFLGKIQSINLVINGKRVNSFRVIDTSSFPGPKEAATILAHFVDGNNSGALPLTKPSLIHKPLGRRRLPALLQGGRYSHLISSSAGGRNRKKRVPKDVQAAMLAFRSHSGRFAGAPASGGPGQ